MLQAAQAVEAAFGRLTDRDRRRVEILVAAAEKGERLREAESFARALACRHRAATRRTYTMLAIAYLLGTTVTALWDGVVWPRHAVLVALTVAAVAGFLWTEWRRNRWPLR